MQITGVPLSELEAISRDVGVEFRVTRTGGKWIRGRIFPDPSKRNGKKPVPYQRSSPMAGLKRKVWAVCWHGHRDWMGAIFRRFPDARIKTGLADYNGIGEFLAKYADTGDKEAGSRMYPAIVSDLCFCEDDSVIFEPEWFDELRAIRDARTAV